MANLYDINDYREFMRAKTEELKEIKGLTTKMAAAAGCQQSHISRVLNSHMHLTLDQASGLTIFWKLSDSESTYFLRLVEYARAGSLPYRQKLEREIARLKQEHENLSKRLELPSIGIAEAELFYYSAWHWSAIHIATTVPELQNSNAIALRLNLPERMVSECLRNLERYGLVAQAENESWVFSSGAIHLAKDSPMNSIQHSNWRTRAVQSAQDSRSDGVHFTTVQSLSEADFFAVKRLVLDTIDEYRKIANPSREEELVCFTTDFFRI